MKIKDIMTRAPTTCTPDMTLAQAARLMGDADCGILPVVDNGEIVGVITDRDICLALARRDERASRLLVGAVASKNVITCTPEQDVHDVLATMKKGRVRRLPVVGFGGAVFGIVSMNDIVLATGVNEDVHSDEVVDVLQAICRHHHAMPQVIPA